MQATLRTTAFALTLVPLIALGVPSATSTYAVNNSVNNLIGGTSDLPEATDTELAHSYKELSVSNPHNQLAVAREIAEKGTVSQSIFVRFLKNRPVFISHMLQFLDLEQEGVVSALKDLIARPRPEWGHDLHKFLGQQEPQVLLSLLEYEARGKISAYHNDIIFGSPNLNISEALNKALASESTRKVSLRVIAATSNKKLVSRVAHLLHDPDTSDHYKIACLESLTAFDTPASIRAIDDALEDESYAVVNQALLSISKVGKTRQHGVLREMMNNPNVNKSNVILALGVSMDPASVKELTYAYMTGTTEQKYAVLEAASISTHTGALRLLVNASMEKDTGIGAKATSLLRKQRLK